MADILLDVQSNPVTPAAGQAVLSVNTTSKRLVVTDDTGRVETQAGLFNSSTANQTGFASDTYLNGSAIALPPSMPRIGTRYKLVWDMTKTAAGTAAMSVVVRVGTLGTTADTARLTFTFAAGTAAIDVGRFELHCHWRSVGASSVLVGSLMCMHHLAATGLVSTGAAGNAILLVTSGAFDSTIANLIIGVSVNGGASFAGTNTVTQARLLNC